MRFLHLIIDLGKKLGKPYSPVIKITKYMEQENSSAEESRNHSLGQT